MAAEWRTPEAMELIRVRRAQGVSFGPIAREIGNGCTTNAAIGASHRANHPRGRARNQFVGWTDAEVAILRANADLLMPALQRLLPGRTRHSIQRKRTSLKLTGPTIGSHGGRWPERAHTVSPLAAVVLPQRRPPPPVVVPEARMPEVAPAPVLRPLGCQWISGDVRTRGWRFCGEPTTGPGSPWCAAHRAVCYGRAVRVAELVD
jgi:hypothetical protein